MTTKPTPESVLEFWFGDKPLMQPGDLADRAPLWFGGRAEDDVQIRARFEQAVEQALAGKFAEWAHVASSRLALIILLDQFTRTIFRGTPRAFVGDQQALSLATDGVSRGLHDQLEPAQQVFFFMPFQHAEDAEVQTRSISLYTQLATSCTPILRPFVENSLSHAQEHEVIIRRFGRFPHRNRVLDRASTQAETDYLSSGAPTFGQ